MKKQATILQRVVIITVCAWQGAVSDNAITNGPVVVYTKDPEPEITFAVKVSDQIKTYGNRYQDTEKQLDIAQGMIQKTLLDDGYRVVNLTGNALDQAQLLQEARDAGADFLISGTTYGSQILSSESDKISAGQADYRETERSRSVDLPFVSAAESKRRAQGSAAGASINRVQESAVIQVQLIRISDGRVMAAEQATSSGSAFQQQQGVQGAIMEATRNMIRKLMGDVDDAIRQQPVMPRQVIDI